MKPIRLSLAIRLEVAAMANKPQKPFMSKHKGVNRFALAVVIGAALYIFVTFWSMSQSNSGHSPETVGPPQPTEFDAGLEARWRCNKQVKQVLKSPKSADFPSMPRIVFDGKTATLYSHVDAQNSFGAMIRSRFICTVQYIGGEPSKKESWVLKDLTMEP